ncbi:hypothetical protein SAMN05660690_2445 [Geodermatophilus telluris]|uniref:Septum formation-related domain-containing protein n=1 Tax=Geodermatophilus telluris TaxID=1190417 RepID=A0A1G6P7X4_9ACTN|nr:hypothetical protein [Geodermatophilus telluris]SDC76189.1 hypothetical protein SAMN05660690_2445 [Geodermatophilus telluris]
MAHPGQRRTPPRPAAAGRGRRAGGVAAAVAVAGGVVAVTLGGFGEPRVGDCIEQEAPGSVDTVDCDSSQAQYRVVGTGADEVTAEEFSATSTTLCAGFETAVRALWRGGDRGEGTVYCVEPV